MAASATRQHHDRSDGVELSIVVCTHNRAHGVRELCDILGPQITGKPVELIIVDSNSRPEHGEAVRALVGAVVQCRLITLDSPGLSIARNAGLSIAAADWIAFLDDDEVPSGDWVERARRLIRRLPDDCAACGGNIHLLYPDNGSYTLSPRWSHYLSAIAIAGEFDQTSAPKLPIGHSVVRATAVRGVGGFDPRLGRIKQSLISGEEVLLLHDMVAAGWTLWHSDQIEVGHRVSADRLTRDWALSRSFWEGVSTFRIVRISDPGHLWLRVVRTALKWPLLRLAAWLCPEMQEMDLRFAFANGFFAELIRRWRRQ